MPTNYSCIFNYYNYSFPVFEPGVEEVEFSSQQYAESPRNFGE